MTATLAALLLALARAAAPAASHAAAGPLDATAEDVHAALVGTRKAVVVDSRSVQEFEQGHIPGAISIPAERTKADAGLLPRDRATPLIFYCRGPG
jgi:rhodanese-related sulfurtransferase